MGLRAGSGGGGGGVVGAGGELVFEWNRVDTSQFEAVRAFADGGAAAALSVVSTARGNVLRFDPSAGNTAHIAFLAVDPLPYVGVRRDAIFELEVFDMFPNGGGYGGIVVLADDAGTYHALNHLVTGPEWASHVNAGTRVTNSANGTGGNGRGGSYKIEMRGSKPEGAPPIVTDVLTAVDETQMKAASGRRTGASAADRGAWRGFAGDAALAASWNDLACDRWGLCLQSGGGANLDVTMEVLDLRVYLL